MKKYILVVFLIASFVSYINAKPKQDILSSLRVVKINSISQKVIDSNCIVLNGDVEVIVDASVHLWADEVHFDNETKRVVVKPEAGGSIVLETSDTLILADQVELNVQDKTGSAKNVRVHLGSDGFLTAKFAEKVSDNKWHFKHVSYTACDSPHRHWSINAKSVWMKNGKVYLYRIPLFKAPIFVGSKENQPNSGFLIPRLSYSKNLGPGIIQEYYWEIGENYDTTLGINWKDRKGFVLYDEFRHITAPEEYSLANIQYARDRKQTVNRDRFWIEGKHFHTIKMKDFTINDLLRVDLGTDKRIGYDFFYNADAVEDKFDNSFISRVNLDNTVISFLIDQEKIFRNKFFFENNTKYKEEDSYRVTRLPHVEWNSAYFPLIKGLYYQNDMFMDQVLGRKRSYNTQDTPAQDFMPFEKSDTVRLYYQGSLFKIFNHKRNSWRFSLNPNFQVRSRLKEPLDNLTRTNVFERRFLAEGAYRAFIKCGAEWSLPELVTTNESKNYSHHVQSIIKWDYVPKFRQDHWYNNDLWDVEYAKNELSFSLKNYWYFDKSNFELHLDTYGDFYKNNDLFSLRRNPIREHFLPVKLQGGINTENLRIGFLQEYDLQSATLLESAIDIGFSFEELSFYSSLLYQNPRLQTTRELLSDIPSFANVGFKLPLYRNIKLSYDANFYSSSNSFFGIFRDSDALLHRVRLDYKGHCWGTSVGFEERRFRQDGNVKSEQSYFFAFKLESLGAFAHNFRKEPEILQAPPDY